MQSRLKAVISQNKRNETRETTYKYMLLILMTAFVVEEFKAILEPREIYIENVHASSVELPLVRVAEDPVDKLDESSLSGERERGEATQTSQVEDLIREAFPEEPEVMIAIAKSESGLNPQAGNKNHNGTIDTGIFQINSIHGYSEEWLKDPENNIKAARKVYEKQGKEAWVVYLNKNYLYNM